MIKNSIKKTASIILAALLAFGFSLSTFASLKEKDGDFTSAALLEQEERQLKWDTKARLEAYRAGDFGDIHDKVYKEHIRDQDPHRLLGTEATTRYGSATKVIDGTEASSETVAQYLSKWFRNDFRLVKLEAINSTKTLYVELDLNNLSTKNLNFYSYDFESNVYNLMSNVDYSIDKAGKISFNSNMVGYVIVSDGELVKKQVQNLFTG